MGGFMCKVRIAKWQGPIAPDRYVEPAQIVQDVPPFRFTTASGMADAILPEFADRRWMPLEPIAEENDADRVLQFENESAA